MQQHGQPHLVAGGEEARQYGLGQHRVPHQKRARGGADLGALPRDGHQAQRDVVVTTLGVVDGDLLDQDVEVIVIRKGKTTRAVPILSREAREYKARMAMYAIGLHASGHQPSQEPVSLTIRLYRPRRAGDIDGPLKPLLDALQGVLYVNDSQIVGLHVTRHDDKDDPRVEVEVN